MKLRPLQDRILVQRVEEATTTKGGIIIPDTAKEKPADEINKLEKTEVEEFKYYNYQEKYRPFVLLAGFLILLEMALRFTIFRSFI